MRITLDELFNDPGFSARKAKENAEYKAKFDVLPETVKKMYCTQPDEENDTESEESEEDDE